ncbi:MAG: DJ-1/PfpI family protein [Terracidiphilus sp.]
MPDSEKRLQKRLEVGAIVFPGIDQMDLTGPFEVLSMLPNSAFYLVWKEIAPVRDMKGLILTPDTTLAGAPALDLLLVPGGWGQEALMDDEEALGFIRTQAAGARYTMSVCTGALICGAAGLLRGVKATTHWSVHHLLKYFGAIPVNARVVIDGKHVSTAGVSAGIDGALRAASLLADERTAQAIQLAMEYAPEPPFKSGTPETAPADVVEAVRASFRQMTGARLATAQQIASRLGIGPVERD